VCSNAQRSELLSTTSLGVVWQGWVNPSRYLLQSSHHGLGAERSWSEVHVLGVGFEGSVELSAPLRGCKVERGRMFPMLNLVSLLLPHLLLLAALAFVKRLV